MTRTLKLPVVAVLGFAVSAACAQAGEAGPLRERLRERLGNLKQQLLQKFDKDGDGRLTGDERKAAIEAARARIAERLGVDPAQLPRFDKDGDGRLSPEEREAVKEYLKQHCQGLKARLLARFDKNGDGKLDEAEREAAKAALKARAGDGPMLKGFPRGPQGPAGDGNLNF